MSDLNEIVIGRTYLFAVYARFAEALGDVDHKTEQDYLLRFLNLENKFNMLQLIVERIKNAVKSCKLAKGNNRPYYYFLIDLEAYFYVMISTLDIMAKLTPYFYSEGQGNKIPTKYFSWQVDFFKKEENSKKDPEYTEHLTNNMDWFEKVREHRNELTHNGALYIFPTSKGKYYFGTKRNERGFIQNVEVETSITETYQGFCDFLVYYNSHFGVKPLKTIPTAPSKKNS